MPLKVIIAGAGMAGGELHLNAYRQVPAVEVIALCDPDLEKANSIAGRKGIPYVYSSIEEALNATFGFAGLPLSMDAMYW
jgi:predicted dehydrogenase